MVPGTSTVMNEGTCIKKKGGLFDFFTFGYISPFLLAILIPNFINTYERYIPDGLYLIGTIGFIYLFLILFTCNSERRSCSTQFLGCHHLELTLIYI